LLSHFLKPLNPVKKEIKEEKKPQPKPVKNKADLVLCVCCNKLKYPTAFAVGSSGRRAKKCTACYRPKKRKPK
jgi:hypothetical protein